MQKRSSLFIRTPRDVQDPRFSLSGAEAMARDYAERSGLEIVETWIVEEDPGAPDSEALYEFAEGIKKDPSITVVLVESLDDAIRNPQDLAELALVVLECGLELHFYATGCSLLPSLEEGGNSAARWRIAS